jgi:dTDP-4-amino-4,6-dideoxygalactose transaminase
LTGYVEAACKTLVTQRMKRSGMRWRHDGGQAILTFRALAQSDRFERGWNLLAATYKRRLSLPRNFVVFPTPARRSA